MAGAVIFGRLIITPINQYSAGELTTMNCSSTLGSSDITWTLIPANQTVNVTLASGSTVYPSLTQLYWIDQRTANESNLIIIRPNASTAGTFICSDNEAFARAELLVNYAYRAYTNASGTLIIGDVITFTLQMVYTGNPFFQMLFVLNRFIPELSSFWEEISNSTSPLLEKTNSTITATVNFYQIASCLSFRPINSIVSFRQPIVDLLPGSATNDINHSHGNVFPPVNVSCVPSITGADSGAVLDFEAILTCKLTSKLPVNYSWTDLTYGNSSKGAQLTVSHSGSYQCNASFNASERLQSVSAAVYNIIVNIQNLSSTAKPLYGPIAGGTNVTLTLENWSTQVANISAVYFGEFLKTTSLQSGRLSNSVVMMTPNATTALIGQLLPITIEFTPGPYNISINLSFTYRDNPEITGISPSTFVFTGGTIVSVNGTQLSSVANPLIQVTLVVERGIDRNTSSEFELCKVNAKDGSQMVCRMPPVMIPDDFLQILDLQYNNRSRRDLNTSALSVTGPNGMDQAIIYLGFILDGYQKYKNINDVLPDTRILIFSLPNINFTKDVLEFDPGKDELISIKGKHMTRGCRMADYVVQVGSDICENIDITDNQLRCRPPKQQLQSNQNASYHCDQLLSIYIYLGFRTYLYACLKYSSRLPVLTIGLAVGLSSFVIVVLLIIAIVCCCKRSRNRSSKSTDNTLPEDTDKTNESYEPPSEQLHANHLYVRPSAQSLYVNEGYEPPSTELYANALELKRR